MGGGSCRNDDMASLGSRIRDSRLQKGKSQGDLAAMVGIKASHLSSIESDRSLPSFAVFVALGQALDTSLDYLALGREPEQAVTGKTYERVMVDRIMDQLRPQDYPLAMAVLKAILEHGGTR